MCVYEHQSSSLWSYLFMFIIRFVLYLQNNHGESEGTRHFDIEPLHLYTL